MLHPKEITQPETPKIKSSHLILSGLLTPPQIVSPKIVPNKLKKEK